MVTLCVCEGHLVLLSIAGVTSWLGDERAELCVSERGHGEENQSMHHKQPLNTTLLCVSPSPLSLSHPISYYYRSKGVSPW